MDKDIKKAIELQNNGHYYQASCVFQSAANKERPTDEKDALWKAAKRARVIADSD